MAYEKEVVPNFSQRWLWKIQNLGFKWQSLNSITRLAQSIFIMLSPIIWNKLKSRNMFYIVCSISGVKFRMWCAFACLIQLSLQLQHQIHMSHSQMWHRLRKHDQSFQNVGRARAIFSSVTILWRLQNHVLKN